MKIKERLAGDPEESGWRDLTIYFHLTDDPNRHICEAQITHRLFLELGTSDKKNKGKLGKIN